MPLTGAPIRVPLDPSIAFPAELPISDRVADLAAAIAAHQVVIVAGETGSGKTTQLPKLCLAMGRGVAGQIGCTQPRRIAATSVAARVAQELGGPLGELVGYKIRFADKTRETSRVKFMTDGILLAEIQSDPLLRRYDTLIVDEAHERSLNIDFLLGFLVRLLPRRRDLRVIVSSATLETERFAKFLGDGARDAPIVEVSGRTYPVDVLYRPPRDDEADLAELVANAVNEITEMDPRGDVLVFVPGEREIREAIAELEQRALPHTVLLPLYGRLAAADQQRVFQRAAQRRVVVATNVAETSLTIPGIVYVVDAGLARINRYDPRTGVSQLLVEPVSRASADQRTGRCGRTANGICVRLYEETDYAARPAHTDPEIKRVSLAGVILRMKSLRLGDIEQFPFLDRPAARAISDGYRVLEELGAIGDDTGDLTQTGHQLARLPLDPRLGRMILGGRDENALREVVVIAAALGLQDPRERPQAVAQRADEAHRQFREDGSDFAGYLKLWAFWRDARERLSRRQLQKLCRDTFLNYHRMREWDDVHEQIVRVMRELDFAPNPRPASAEQIHRGLLPGLLSRVGMWNREARSYVGARQTRFAIHPGSALAKKPPPWVMAAELVETSQLFARTCASIDPAWLERAGGALCRRTFGDPHWEQRGAQVMVKEHVTLYGLPIIKDRSVPYARRDPVRCRELFIVHALIRHEYATKARFMAHNQRVVDEAQRMRDKARRSDMFAADDDLFAFFDQRLPPDACTGAAFEAWLAGAEKRDPAVLQLSLADVLSDDAAELTPARYPDELVVGGMAMPLTYRFEPSEDDDGATLTVPLAVLPQLDAGVMAWTIPGWHAAKIRALLDGLPKALRKALAPVDELAEALAAELAPFRGAMLPALERAIAARTGERIPRDAWDLRTLPPYLSFMFRVVGERDHVVGDGRDLAELQRVLGARARELWAAKPREALERTGIRRWDFGDLPESIEVSVAGGTKARGYPALVDADSHVDLRVMESPAAAARATRAGLRRLALFAIGTSYGKLDAQLPAGVPKEVRRDVAVRALDEALANADPPRTAAAFDDRVAAAFERLPLAVARLGRLAGEIAAELLAVRAALRPLAGKPGVAKAVVDDVESQLAHLAPPAMFEVRSLPRLEHTARYLKALRVRLQRQANDPMKDQGKAAHVVPLWQAFVAARPSLRARGRTDDELDELAWLVEELRVAVFSPELAPAAGVTPALVQQRWAALSR